MLAQLTISNFAIVRELDVDFQSGMTAITGETGAGKSIAIDALSLCLGARCEAEMVRPGAKRADLCARFHLQQHSSALNWLQDKQLDEGDECLLRRVINADGRSRGFINGTAVPLSQLRELGQLLIQIHGQHAHQLLLKPEHQRLLLDAYLTQSPVQQSMKQHYQAWHQHCRQLATLQQLALTAESRRDLLHYQLKELDSFAPKQGEFAQIEQDYQLLANSGERLTACQQMCHLLTDGDEHNLQSMLHTARSQLEHLLSLDDHLRPLATMLDDATILISEVGNELRHYQDDVEIDPNQLQELEQRLSRYLTLAKKHRISPDELAALHQQLQNEYQTLNNYENDIAQLTTEVNKYYEQAVSSAAALHQLRSLAAEELSALITDSMHKLAMPHGHFAIKVTFNPERLTQDGADHIDFNVSTNPGQPLSTLSKVASGGELSRIALAIQVITARKMETPALIFDEVDVGISGPTAAIVGQMLRQLGDSTQVLCVTHLPQVAGCGHNHFFISKITDGLHTETTMERLDRKARLNELARLLGGNAVTRNTLANAKELLAA